MYSPFISQHGSAIQYQNVFFFYCTKEKQHVAAPLHRISLNIYIYIFYTTKHPPRCSVGGCFLYLLVQKHKVDEADAGAHDACA